jgi:hypothetical protein
MPQPLVEIQRGTDGQAQAVHPTYGPIKAFIQIPEEGGAAVRLIDTQVALIDSMLQYVRSMGSELVGDRDSRLVIENLIREIRSTLTGEIKTYLQQTSTGSERVTAKLDDLILRVSQLSDRLSNVQGVLEAIRTIMLSVNTQLSSISNQIITQTALLEGVKTPTAYTLTLTATDRATTQVLPNNTRRLSFGVRRTSAGVYPDVFYGFRTEDRVLLPEGARFYEKGLSLTGTTLFLTPVVANTVADILVWV